MLGKYFVSGYVKKTLEDEWSVLRDLPAMTDDLEKISQELIKAGMNYFIFTVRRNEKWVEPLRAQTSTVKEDFGNKSKTIYSPRTDSTSSETPSTEGPTDTI